MPQELPEAMTQFNEDDEASLRSLRRQRDHEMYAELKALQRENQNYTLTITVMEIAITDLRKDFEGAIAALRKDFELYVALSREAVATAQAVANAGGVGRTVVYSVIAVTAAIGGIATLFELIKRWHPS